VRKTDGSFQPVPTFVGLSPASEAASRAKRGNRKRDTKPELVLRRALWAAGLRYRIHASHLPGNPDIVFRASRVVVFCDGDFWHGRDWPVLQEQLSRRHNADYWIAKICRNRERDALHTARLAEEGWLVLRFWENDIIRDPSAVAAAVREAVRRRLDQGGSATANSPPC
jgi:DNA mismatch endonuclease (patch repair protein)